jgi:hypothetical protein
MDNRFSGAGWLRKPQLMPFDVHCPLDGRIDDLEAMEYRFRTERPGRDYVYHLDAPPASRQTTLL